MRIINLKVLFLFLLIGEASANSSPSSQASLRAVNALKDSLAIQNAAISKYENLSRKVSGGEKEKELLSQLIEAYSRAAQIQIQLINRGELSESETKFYHQYLQKLLSTSSRYLELSPNDSRKPQIQFYQARAYKELGRIEQAIESFQAVIRNYPKKAEAHHSAILLNSLLSDLKRYSEAAEVLKQHEENFPKSYRPLVYDRLIQNLLNQNENTEALLVSKKLLTVNVELAKNSKDPDWKKRPEIKAAFEQMANVFSKAIAEDDGNFSIEMTVREMVISDLFEASSNGLKHFAIQLVDKNKPDKLLQFIRFIQTKAEKESQYALVGIEVLLLSMEQQIQKRDFSQANSTLTLVKNQIQKGVPKNLSEKVFRTVSKVAFFLQSNLKSEKEELKAKEIGRVLVSAYEIMVRQYSDRESDPKNLKQLLTYRYNLAEVASRIELYDVAASNYFWIVQKENLFEQESALIKDSFVKAIRSRYLDLKDKKILQAIYSPDHVEKSEKGEQAEVYTATENATEQENLLKSTAPSIKKVDPKVFQWVQWVEKARKKYPDAPLELFQYEAARILYATGERKIASERLISFIESRPKSKVVISAAALVIENLINGENADWNLAGELSQRWLRAKMFVDGELNSRLASIQSESAYRIVESLYRTKKYNEVIQQVDLIVIPETKNAKRTADLLLLAMNASVALNDLQLALTYSQKIKTFTADPSILAYTYLTDSKIYAQLFNWTQSTKSSVGFLSSPMDARRKWLKGEEEIPFKQKTLQSAWLSGQYSALSSLVSSQQFCTVEVKNDCRKYLFLSVVMPSTDTELTALLNRLQNLVQSQETISEDEALLLSLGEWKGRGGVHFSNALSVKEFSEGLSSVLSGWSSLDIIARNSAYSLLLPTINQHLQAFQSGVKKFYPVQLNREVLSKRVAIISSIESNLNLISKNSELEVIAPELKIGLMNLTAGLYLDFVTDVKTLKPEQALKANEMKSFHATLDEVVAPFLGKVRSLTKNSKEFAKQYAFSEQTTKTIQELHSRAFPEERTDLALTAESGVGISKPNHWTAAAGRNGEFIAKAIQEGNYPGALFMIYSQNAQSNKTSQARINVLLGSIFDQIGSYALSQQYLKSAEAVFGKNFTGLEKVQRSIASSGGGEDSHEENSGELSTGRNSEPRKSLKKGGGK